MVAVAVADAAIRELGAYDQLRYGSFPKLAKRCSDGERAPEPLLPFAPSPAESSRLGSRMAPWWRRLLFELFDRERMKHRAVALADLWPLPSSLQTRHAVQALQLQYSSHRSTLALALLCMEWPRWWRSALLQACAAALDAATPLLVFQLMSAAVGSRDHAGEDDSLAQGLNLSVSGCVFGISVLLAASVIVSAHQEHVASQISARVTGALESMLLRRFVETPLSTPPQRTPHQLSSPIASVSDQFRNDIPGIAEAFVELFTPLTVFFQLLVELLVFSQVVGFPFRLGVYAVLMLSGASILESFAKQHALQDRREHQLAWRSLVSDSLKNILTIKLHGWESKMLLKILTAKNWERVSRSTVDTWKMVQLCFQGESVTGAMMVSLVCWLAFERPSVLSSPAVVFTTLVLTSRMHTHVNILVHRCDLIVKGFVAAQILDQVLRNDAEIVAQLPMGDSAVLQLERAVFIPHHRSASAPPASATSTLLANVNIALQAGDLVVVHGRSGEGKSLLLAGMLGHIKPVFGSRWTNQPRCRVIGFCPQKPWLQATSIRENILLGSKLDEKRYNAVLDACCLLEDLKRFPDGDLSFVNELNLSSGQKALIALARACYADADIIILDSPFANVDPIIQSTVFRKCIVKLLMTKTVVIATHNPEIIGSSFADQVIEVENGAAFHQQTPRVDSDQHSKRVSAHMAKHPWQSNAEELGKSKEQSITNTLILVEPVSTTENIAIKSEIDAIPVEAMEDPVSLSILWSLLPRHLVRRPLLFLGTTVLTMILLSTTKDLWLVRWCSTSPSLADNVDATSFVVGFALIAAAQTVASVGSFVLHCGTFDQATNELFAGSVRALLFAPTSVISSRQHTTDDIASQLFDGINMIEDRLPVLVAMGLDTAASCVIMTLVIAWYSGLVGCLVLATGWLTLHEIRTASISISLKRLETTVRRRHHALLTDTLCGGAVISSLGVDCIERFLIRHAHSVDTCTRASRLRQIYQNNCRIRESALPMYLGIVIALAAQHEDITPAALGLCIFYLLSISQVMLVFHFVLRQLLQAIGHIRALQHFVSIEEEESPVSSVSPPAWPPNGAIRYKNVSLAFPRGVGQPDQMALTGVSLEIRSGEKIGIIGRTGSGKSSLVMALFRIQPLASGRIQVDGVDINTLSLSVLRRSMTVIPQTPIFFSGTIREYLDPFGEYAHDAGEALLWSRLRLVGLTKRVRSLEEQIEGVDDKWSVGELQMLTFARALLRPPQFRQIVIFDESFSAVDAACEEALIQLLKAEFAASTVLLITHRVEQILSFDRILVMSGGSVAESGSASDLVGNPHSMFYQFLESEILSN